ncbi:MAG: GMP synthase [Proteobacteria bacterium]|nr:MAG: GMP synthase [Pseudomonadota bacterium]
MLIGILETGRPPEELADRYDSYAVMFQTLLRAQAADFSFKSYAVLEHEFPKSPKDCDAWLITGSKHGAYENLPWIHTLKDFIRTVNQARVPMVGICFGHQIIAAALGGVVDKSAKGWGIGIHEYHLQKAATKAMEGLDSFRIYAMHQDQVIQCPPDAEVVATSAFCEYAALFYGDHILTFQGHPEFTDHFEQELLKLRKGSVIPEAQVDAILQELEKAEVQAEGNKVGTWMADFFLK